jgi:hypothetical protein
MSKTIKLQCAAAAGLVAAGLALKGVRYWPAETAGEADLAPRIERVLAGHGWQAVAADRRPAESAYKVLAFEKPGCAGIAYVAVLGSGRELGDYVRHVVGEDVAFLQDGVLSPRPSALGRHLATIKRMARGGGAPLPLMAIAPAPGPAVEPCRPADTSVWEKLATGN